MKKIKIDLTTTEGSKLFGVLKMLSETPDFGALCYLNLTLLKPIQDEVDSVFKGYIQDNPGLQQDELVEKCLNEDKLSEFWTSIHNINIWQKEFTVDEFCNLKLPSEILEILDNKVISIKE